jgi:diaminopimelate epimerase
MSKLPFLKMHGLGNDFVVLDARQAGAGIGGRDLTIGERQWLADRHRGIGCDQLITLEPPVDPAADVFMRIHNADGSEARACGNATRCVAAKVMGEKATGHAVIQTVAGLLATESLGNGEIAVDMGPALLDWRDIPVAAPCDTLHLPVGHGPVSDPVGVNVGSSHAVFFVDDVAAVDVAGIGPALELNAFFPDRANIEFAQVLAPDHIRMRVWERGAGITLACGSGACATLVAAARRGLTGRKAVVEVDGGKLTIEWLENGNVRMTGPWTLSFAGEVDLVRIGATHV